MEALELPRRVEIPLATDTDLDEASGAKSRCWRQSRFGHTGVDTIALARLLNAPNIAGILSLQAIWLAVVP